MASLCSYYSDLLSGDQFGYDSEEDCYSDEEYSNYVVPDHRPFLKYLYEEPTTRSYFTEKPRSRVMILVRFYLNVWIHAFYSRSCLKPRRLIPFFA